MLLDPAINVPKEIEEFISIIFEDLLRPLTGRDGEVILDGIKTRGGGTGDVIYSHSWLMPLQVPRVTLEKGSK